MYVYIACYFTEWIQYVLYESHKIGWCQHQTSRWCERKNNTSRFQTDCTRLVEFTEFRKTGRNMNFLCLRDFCAPSESEGANRLSHPSEARVGQHRFNARVKTRALNLKGGQKFNSSHVANIIFCIARQRTATSCHRIGQFQHRLWFGGECSRPKGAE